MHPLEAFRRARNLTYQGLADLIGVPQATMARKYCHGLSMPEPSTMRKIAEVTGYSVTANDFYGISLPPAGRRQRGRAEC